MRDMHWILIVFLFLRAIVEIFHNIKSIMTEENFAFTIGYIIGGAINTVCWISILYAVLR